VTTRAWYRVRGEIDYRAPMIDHLAITVSDLAKSVAFYKQALAPLGYELIMSTETFAGFGLDGTDLWLGKGAPKDHVHVAFRAKSRSLVRAFYEAAIAAGGKDNGGPGVREIYHPDYFGAYVLDPDGHNIEACCHEAYLG
jgi:catechol 2,3-dioxygenase-like lactoylglutathione lyase family enzyme